MGSKKADRWIILSLLAALAVEMLFLAWHLGIFTSVNSSATSNQKVAGLIVKNENELRRRSADSLVWEKSSANESVFYFDSVLTLAQSTAALKLEHDTEIDLHENTLVTIEPTEESVSGEIRLKFVRGNLRARNPFTETNILAPEFSVNLKAGSEMQMRQTGEREFEVQILKGEAQVRDENGAHTVNSSNLLRLKDGKGESLERDARLKWLNSPPARVYSHNEKAEMQLAWEGEAAELRVQKSGAPEAVIPLRPNQHDLKLSLEPGDHLVYLRSNKSTSAALPLQLWKAPLLHLISPLPRDRVRTDEDVSFLWMRSPGISAYEFKLEGRGADRTENRAVNTHQVRFQDESDARWSVWGKDNEGYSVPPLYEYPLYIRHKPLAAPKLNAPRLRRPAQAIDKGASFRWMDLILPSAHADESAVYEAYFSWEAVPGADEYWIEISESPDFRKPALSKRLGGTEFVWREFRDKIYYWRVAAGNKSGRMGIFSEPAKISIHEGIEVKKIEIATQSPAPAPAPVAEAPPAEKPKTEVLPKELSAASEPRPQKPRGFRFIWRPGYSVMQEKGEQNIKANLAGAKLFSVAAEKDFFVFDRRWWTVELKYSSVAFKPKSKSEYPFQEEIKASSTELKFTRVKETGMWGFGVSGAVRPRIVRAGPESARAEGKASGGVHTRTLLNLSGAEYQGDFGLNAGSGEYGFSSSHRLLIHAWKDRLLLGIGTEGYYLMRGSNNSFGADGFAALGFEF